MSTEIPYQSTPAQVPTTRLQSKRDFPHPSPLTCNTSHFNTLGKFNCNCTNTCSNCTITLITVILIIILHPCILLYQQYPYCIKLLYSLPEQMHCIVQYNVLYSLVNMPSCTMCDTVPKRIPFTPNT